MNLSSVCARDSQGGNPSGKALVIQIRQCFVVLHKMPRGARAAFDCFSTFEKVYTIVSPDQISLRVNTPNLKKFKYLNKQYISLSIAVIN